MNRLLWVGLLSLVIASRAKDERNFRSQVVRTVVNGMRAADLAKVSVARFKEVGEDLLADVRYQYEQRTRKAADSLQELPSPSDFRMMDATIERQESRRHANTNVDASDWNSVALPRVLVRECKGVESATDVSTLRAYDHRTRATHRVIH
ncbi:hypothetical protein [Ferroacidibacillus organovorans]|uniref:Uncharacterized protein n=1 Tax=Ferroacidibacillus organovorans TaxID=1765683 RepID=A0A853KJ39_9BACL|nr:hypothetical protein [Ferroacidibacillus organovorans]KYP80827.1 hypothetical protein AYJ22_01320 [Ferroacidibacillus organovorans]OAG95360.1 hypothetical protein AYW79_00125 [Ferroacidibacillus organovorans]